MKVKLIKRWFAPTVSKQVNAIYTTSGMRYRPGVHEMPEALRPFLPKTAVVLSDEVFVEQPKTSNHDVLRHYDEAAIADAETERRLEAITVARDKQPKSRMAKELKE